jgi:hypothetical protein
VAERLVGRAHHRARAQPGAGERRAEPCRGEPGAARIGDAD